MKENERTSLVQLPFLTVSVWCVADVEQSDSLSLDHEAELERALRDVVLEVEAQRAPPAGVRLQVSAAAGCAPLRAQHRRIPCVCMCDLMFPLLFIQWGEICRTVCQRNGAFAFSLFSGCAGGLDPG